MLSWIRNLHTCKTNSFCWHGRVWLVLGPSPPQAQQEQPQGCCSLFPSAPPLPRSCSPPVGSTLPARSLALGQDCWSSTHGCSGTWLLLSLCWL